MYGKENIDIYNLYLFNYYIFVKKPTIINKILKKELPSLTKKILLLVGIIYYLNMYLNYQILKHIYT